MEKIELLRFDRQFDGSDRASEGGVAGKLGRQGSSIERGEKEGSGRPRNEEASVIGQSEQGGD